MHFRPSELPEDRRTLIFLLFLVHIIILVNCVLNIIINCIEGGLDILYSFLFLFIFNPIVLFLFYRGNYFIMKGYMGLCKEKPMLGLFLYMWPLIVLVLITISIIDFLGFNGFIRVNRNFSNHQVGNAVFGLIISIIFLAMALGSSVLYFQIFRRRSILTKALL